MFEQLAYAANGAASPTSGLGGLIPLILILQYFIFCL